MTWSYIVLAIEVLIFTRLGSTDRALALHACRAESIAATIDECYLLLPLLRVSGLLYCRNIAAGLVHGHLLATPLALFRG